MAIIKCKMCGGDLDIIEGASTAECEFCGSVQTLPKSNDSVIQNLFIRANHLRMKCEFDKAEQIYEKILHENDAEAEAHWGIVLCKYGIEYVEDPKTYKRIPTCHRTSYDAVTADADYLAAIAHADPAQKNIYTTEAKAIDAIQRDILNIVKNEKPFDVFICYKETDENGKRTQDSVIANDIYYQLTQEGLKVFYAAITLEDKLGQEYEPYIFAALNSSKVMLVIGTNPAYYSAVWVKNEWSRFLKLMKADRSKLLIPCYKDMDAYDLPDEFAHLQAQDMGKIGFINDVVRGIKKVIVKEEPKATVVQKTVPAGPSNLAPLLERAFMFLEDGNWGSATEYCEKVLDQDPKNARAYLGKLMAELHVRKQENLKDLPKPFDGSNHYQKVIRFANDALKNTLTGYNHYIVTRNENARLESIYSRANNLVVTEKTENAYKEAAGLLETIPGYKDSAELARTYYEKAEIARLNAIYDRAWSLIVNKKTEKAYKEAAGLLETIPTYKDSAELARTCYEKAEVARLDDIFTRAKDAMASAKTDSAFKNAAGMFETIPEYKDAAILVRACYEKAEAAARTAKVEKHKSDLRIDRSRFKGVIISVIILAVLISVFVYAYRAWNLPEWVNNTLLPVTGEHISAVIDIDIDNMDGFLKVVMIITVLIVFFGVLIACLRSMGFIASGIVAALASAAALIVVRFIAFCVGYAIYYLIEPWGVLALAGIFCILVLIAGKRMITKRYTAYKWVCCLLCVALALGARIVLAMA